MIREKKVNRLLCKNYSELTITEKIEIAYEKYYNKQKITYDGVPIRDYKKLINLMGTPASGKSLEVMKLRGFCYVKQHYIEI